MSKGIVIHHSATPDSPAKNWDAIRRYHIEVNGWRDVGYHFGVELVGGEYQILGGRPVHEMGAHTAGYNDLIGICLVGDFDKAPPPDDALHRLFCLVLGLLVAFNLSPDTVYFHSDYSAKSCPGKHFPKSEFIRRLQVAHARCTGQMRA